MLDETSPCPFCTIAATYPPFPPSSPPLPSSPLISSTKLSPQAFILLSTPTTIAFLDIQPLSPGHILLCPRPHRTKYTSVTPRESAVLGRDLLVISRAVTKITGVNDWNVVQNNGAAAAQVVPHVHFHVIPRPEIRRNGRVSEHFTMFGKGVRSDLDEEEAEVLAGRIRECVAEVVREMEREEGGNEDDVKVKL